MHEMSIAQNICDIVTEEIRNLEGIGGVTKINMKIGKLSGVVPDSLRFCFGFVSEGTPAEGAVLQIDEVPVEAACNQCGGRFNLDKPLFICPSCGSGDLDIVQGRELLIESIEVEEATVQPRAD